MVNIDDIIRPDYEKAPIVSFDLSGTQLVMRLPEHELGYRSELASHQIDIHDRASYERDIEKGPFGSMTLAKSGWIVNSSQQKPVGHISLLANLNEIPLERYELSSLFDSVEFQRWLLTSFQRDYGKRNEEILNELKFFEKTPTPTSFWVYPKSIEELHTTYKEGVPWCLGREGHPSMPPIAFCVSTPITHRHQLYFSFGFKGFLEEITTDVFDELLEGLVNDFLSHVALQYSPEVLSEIAAVDKYI